jgi:maleylpyruvate isomerase
MAPNVPLDRLLTWQQLGTALVEEAVGGLSDDEFNQPCGLAGWHRTHLVAHLARNADALVNLLNWAATGVPTPMYATPGQRNTDIETAARQSPAALQADLLAANGRLTSAIVAMPSAAWSEQVVNAQGKDIQASEVPWMRIREVWIHLVDLAAKRTFNDLPADLITALMDDIMPTLAAQPDAPAVELVSTDGQRWSIGDDGTEVSGPATLLLALVSGRATPEQLAALECDGELPALPRWL